MPTSPSSKPVRLGLTMGDPAGIGPEVLLRSLTSPRSSSSLTIIGDLAHLKQLARKLRIAVPWDLFEWADVPNVPKNVRMGVSSAGSGRAAYGYLEKAVGLIRRGRIEGLVTAPVSKEAVAASGVKGWIGHTEFLGEAFRRPTVMMFTCGSFRVSLVTTHLAVRLLPGKLNLRGVRQVLAATKQALTRDFGVKSPRIGLCALNPHGGESGMFGEEEVRILRPAARSVSGVAGPIPADTAIRQAAGGEFDALVAIYHDQALIPLKLLGWSRSVNVTLGLPFVRTSPVHGTAFDIAGKGTADPGSMRSAIALAADLARHRRKR